MSSIIIIDMREDKKKMLINKYREMATGSNRKLPQPAEGTTFS